MKTMEPRALGVSSTLAPWSTPYIGPRHMRGSRGPAPLGCLPLWGREGVTLPNSTECKGNGFHEKPMERKMRREQKMQKDSTIHEAALP